MSTGSADTRVDVAGEEVAGEEDPQPRDHAVEARDMMLYLMLLLLRLVVAIVLLDVGYVHPDEFLQVSEVMAGLLERSS
jgi:hypothetical protein